MNELKDYWKDYSPEIIIRVETPDGGYYTKYEDFINMHIFFDKLEQDEIHKDYFPTLHQQTIYAIKQRRIWNHI